jgi:hypothetical protein
MCQWMRNPCANQTQFLKSLMFNTIHDCDGCAWNLRRFADCNYSQLTAGSRTKASI